MSMFDLGGKNAFVTGSSRGIGSGIAKALATAGANVAVNCVSNTEKCDLISMEIKNMGKDSFSTQGDVSKKADVERIFSQVKEKWGHLDILVNNAGVIDYGDFESITEEQWDRVIDINLKGQFLCSQEAVKLMKENSWGRIINIASISSGGVGIGFKSISYYTASKGGVVALTENMANERSMFEIKYLVITVDSSMSLTCSTVLSDENLL